MLKTLHLQQRVRAFDWQRLMGRPGFLGGYSVLLWLVITLLFLSERTYLIQKAGLPHFAACVVVRVGLLLGLCYGHIQLAERLMARRRYGLYGLFTTLALAAYLLLQGCYDRYLFGFVIGDQERASLWQNLPYNLVVTNWYLLLTYLIARRPAVAQPALLPSAAAAPVAGSEVVVIKTEGEWRRLPVACIRYAQGLKDYTVLHTHDGKHLVKGSIGKTAEWLPAGHFLRVHKSYLVAQQHIKSVSSTEVRLEGVAIPIGRAYADQLAAFKRSENIPLA